MIFRNIKRNEVRYNSDDIPFKIPEKYIDNKNGFFGDDDRWNSLIIYKDKKYRHRVETLIIRDDMVYMNIRKSRKMYRLPGGSVERDIPDIIQAENEVNEEARLMIVNIKSTGLSYIRPFYKSHYMEYDYDYIYTDVYLADYAGEYTGVVDSRDADERMYTFGTFYNYKRIRHILTYTHKSILDNVFMQRGIL